MEWGSTIFPTCASRANFRVRVCRYTSRMADSATPFVACSHPKIGHAKNVTVFRATIDGSSSLCNIALRYPSRRNKDTNHDVALTHSLTHSLFSQISCSTRSRVHIFRNQDEQFIFASFRRRNHHLLCHQASTNHNLSRQVVPRPLHQAPAIPRSLMQASHQVRCWACPDATWCLTSSLVGPRPTTITLHR